MSCESQLLQPTGRTCCSHWLKTAGSAHNSYDWGTAFLRVSKWIGPYCRSWKKCGDFDNEQAVPECLPEPPHRSRTLSKSSSHLPQQLCPGEAGSQASAPHAQATPVTAVGSQQTWRHFVPPKFLTVRTFSSDSFRNADVFKRPAKVVL